MAQKNLFLDEVSFLLSHFQIAVESSVFKIVSDQTLYWQILVIEVLRLPCAQSDIQIACTNILFYKTKKQQILTLKKLKLKEDS